MPYVSGIVALLQNQHPEWSYTQVIERVLTTVDVLPSLAGKMVSGGRVNAAAALAATSIHVSDPIVVEGDSGETQMVFRISRRGDTAGTVVLDWTTLDGTAMAGTDYVATSGQVVFSDPTVNEIDIPVLVNGDADGEWAETLHLELALGSGTALIADPLALGTIVDDDTLTFPSNDVPKALKDAKNDSQWGVTTSTIDVTAEGEILDLNVLVDINHTAPNQLRASLFAPDGTQVVLFSHVGSWSGSFTDTTLDDQARMSILSGTSPFTGSYQPMDSLAVLNGMSLAGKWTLEVIDRWKQDTGTLNNWALEIKTYASESNNPPNAMDDAATTDEDEAVAVDVLTNDSDLDSDPLTMDSVTQGANGNVIDNGDGTVTYTPDANFHGTDSVTYTISDGRGGTDTATVYVIIDPIADPPVAVDDLASTERDTAVLVDVLANDLEVDNDPVGIVGFTDGANGTVSDNGDGTLTYAPGAGFTGEDTFTYTISDGIRARRTTQP